MSDPVKFPCMLVPHGDCMSDAEEVQNYSFARMDNESWQTFLEMYQPELEAEDLDPKAARRFQSTMPECDIRKDGYVLCQDGPYSSKGSFHCICRQDTGFWTGTDFWMSIPPRPKEDFKEGPGKIDFDDNDGTDYAGEQVKMKKVMEEQRIDQLDNETAHFYACDRGHQAAANEAGLAMLMGLWSEFANGYTYRGAQKKFIREESPNQPHLDSFRRSFRTLAPPSADERTVLLGAIAMGLDSGELTYAKAKIAMYYFNRADVAMTGLPLPKTWTEDNVEANLDRVAEAVFAMKNAKKWVASVEANSKDGRHFVPMTDRQFDLYQNLKVYVDIRDKELASLMKYIISTPAECAEKHRKFVHVTKPCGRCEDGYRLRRGKCVPEGRCPTISTRSMCNGLHRRFVHRCRPCGNCILPYEVNPNDRRGACIRGSEPGVCECSPKPPTPPASHLARKDLRERFVAESREQALCVKQCEQEGKTIRQDQR